MEQRAWMIWRRFFNWKLRASAGWIWLEDGYDSESLSYATHLSAHLISLQGQHEHPYLSLTMTFSAI